MAIPIGQIKIRNLGDIPWVCIAIIVLSYLATYQTAFVLKRVSVDTMIWLTQYCGDLNPLPLIGHLFGHGSLRHLSGNMLFLWSVGPWIERLVGHWRFILLYLGLGIASSLVSDLCDLYIFNTPEVCSCGASGAICGLMGVMAVRLAFKPVNLLFERQFPSPIRIPYWLFFAEFFIFQLVYFYNSFFKASNVGYAAHLGGLFAGMIVGARLGGFRLARRDHIWEKTGWLLGRRNNQREVVNQMRRAADLTPRDAAAFCEIGDAEAKMGNHKIAKEKLERGIFLYSRNPETAAESCFWMQTWLRHYPQTLLENRTVVLEVAHVFAKQQEVHKALQLYDLLAVDPSTPEKVRDTACVQRAYLTCAKIGNLETGLALYRDYFARFPNSPHMEMARQRYEYYLKGK